MTGRWLRALMAGTADRSSVLRVAGSKTLDAALAQNDVRIALGQDVLGREQQVVDASGRTAFQNHRFPGLA